MVVPFKGVSLIFIRFDFMFLLKALKAFLLMLVASEDAARDWSWLSCLVSVSIWSWI